MIRKRALAGACAAILCALAQAADFSIELIPNLGIPLGPRLDNQAREYAIGGGARLEALYSPGAIPFLMAGLVAAYDLAPISGSDASASFLSCGPSLGLNLRMGPRLSARLMAEGGLFSGIIGSGSVVDPWLGASLDLGYRLSPNLGLGLGASYSYYHTPTGSAYEGIGVRLGLRYRFGSGGVKVDMQPRPEPIFPLFYSWYDKHPLGTLILSNGGMDAIDEARISFYVPQFMEGPKECWYTKHLAAGESVELPLYAILRDSIFQVTEATKVQGEIQLSGKLLGKDITKRQELSLTVNNRNAMVWDDTRKAAAFVTAKDDTVRGFALRYASDARSGGEGASNTNFRLAMSLFEALRLHGVAYVSDPSSPYAGPGSQAVDFLQFPAQTLSFKGGDCDDLSILYAALLEACGVEAAFITTPGHIFVAFKLNMGREDAKALFRDDRELIFTDGDEAWLPVEITAVKEGFISAWKRGAQECLAAKATMALVPVRQAWQEFEPANTGALTRENLAMPAQKLVADAFKTEMARFFASELQPRVSELKGALAKAKTETPGIYNRLGLIYARFGMFGEARRNFEASLTANGQTVSALANLGNLAFIEKSYDSAIRFYTRALAIEPGNLIALRGLIRASWEAGKKAEALAALERLTALAPDIAKRYEYVRLGDQDRR